MKKHTAGVKAELLQLIAQNKTLAEVARGEKPADLVFKNASYVNVFTNQVETGDIAVAGGFIAGIGNYRGREEIDLQGKVLLPGFIDGHIHLESSLISPQEFVKAVLSHGTTAVIVDPHEITNVMGTQGLKYMLQATENLPVDVFFMLPSCVPATPMDEAGARLTWRDINPFYKHPRVQGLAEMMNYYGVIHGDKAVLAKLAAAQQKGKRIDGHAPGLGGKDLEAYIACGIGSDHECASLPEAKAKLSRGQYIMIREGTAAQNLAALSPLLTPQYAARCLFCTDDKHPNDLLDKGHIDYIVRSAIQRHAIDPIIAVKAASFQAAQYFHLDNRGAIAPGYWADLVAVDDLKNFQVQQVWKRGLCQYRNGTLLPFNKPEITPALEQAARHTFHVKPIAEERLQTKEKLGVIGLIPGEIITTDNGVAEHIDVQNDILKVAVIERHHNTGHIGLGYLQGYGLKRGAVATSVAHDSHNLIVVGTNEADMAIAANQIILQQGGIAVVEGGNVVANVVLEIAGVMSDVPLQQMNEQLENAKRKAKALGVKEGVDPFMTLSFISLPVIPSLRLTTRGLVRV